MTDQFENSSASSHVPGILSPPKMWKEHVSSYFQLLDFWFIRHPIVDELGNFGLLILAMSEQQQCSFASEIGFRASTSTPYSASSLLVSLRNCYPFDPVTAYLFHFVNRVVRCIEISLYELLSSHFAITSANCFFFLA